MGEKGRKEGRRKEREGKGKRKKGGQRDEHTSIHTHGEGTGEDEQGPDPLSLSRSLLLAFSRPRSLARLVTPTMSTLVQDNTRLILPLVFHLAPTHLGRGTQRQIHSSVHGPPGSETPTGLKLTWKKLRPS
jgi:hypothetical protein